MKKQFTGLLILILLLCTVGCGQAPENVPPPDPESIEHSLPEPAPNAASPETPKPTPEASPQKPEADAAPNQDIAKSPGTGAG